MINFINRGKIKKLTALALAVLMAAALSAHAPASAAEKRDLRFYAIDVGQGDSSLFIFPTGETMLVDAGPSSSAKDLTRYLKQCGVKKINILVATHPHSDHIGGMSAVIAEFSIGEIWDSGYAHGSDLQIKFYQTIKDKKIPFGRPKRGYKREIGGAQIEVLGPAQELSGTSSDANNNSIVLRVAYGNVSFLMTGDMDKEQRRTISPLPESTVLKAAHHGSRTGTDAKLLREVSPMVIIFSYKKGNSYGHPHKEVLRLLAKNQQIKRFDTANGTVKLRTDGKSLTYPKNMVVNTDEQTN